MCLARLVRCPAQRVQALIFELELDDRSAAEVDSYLRDAAVEQDRGPTVSHCLRTGGERQEHHEHYQQAAGEHHGTPV
jgi:hypothetical protein